MTRCDYDTIFQRVFCVTLVAIAFTFTVILTNVFVDIDGLLSKKTKDKAYYDAPEPVLANENDHVKIIPLSNIIRPEVYYKEQQSYDEEREDEYRSKRSLESSNFVFRMKNPKMKSILNNRLATLLEELDKEESTNIQNKVNGPKTLSETQDVSRIEPKQGERVPSVLANKNNENINTELEKVKHETKDEDSTLHLAMHNILLQGIIGHMDLNDVYKKVHLLVQNFDGEGDKSSKLKKEEETTKTAESSFEENKILEEVVKCDKLQNDIAGSTNNAVKTQKGPKISIKTVIDITSNKKAQNTATEDSKENIKGFVELIYNGKSVQLTKPTDNDWEVNKKSKETAKQIKNHKTKVKSNNVKVKPNSQEMDEGLDRRIVQNQVKLYKESSLFNKIMDEYLKEYPYKARESLNSPDLNVDQRPKREIKIKYQDNVLKTKTSKLKDKATDDDELYVEIETHFDSKGMKGERKKKIIHNIIDKISKAIHTDLEIPSEDSKKKKQEHLQVKKRIQNPLLNHFKIILNKKTMPLDGIEERYSDPISKSVPADSPMPNVYDKSGESWKKTYMGPGFLTSSKSINSAETGDVDVNYSKVLDVNGVPQRLQKPLNVDENDEIHNENTFFQLGNLKFFIKNIEGTGMSIGFNQYTDGPPDPDAIKLFTGVEGLVKKYNQNYADTEHTPMTLTEQIRTSSEENIHHLSKREAISRETKRRVMTRSAKEMTEKDYHSNYYKIISGKNFLPYNNYREIYEDNKTNKAINLHEETKDELNTHSHDASDIHSEVNKIKIKELMDDNNIFDKKLKPSQILSIASLLDRKKRSLKVKKISNIRSKTKLNRYINTRRTNKQKIILYKKRSKRQVDKIRIIARDLMPKTRNSEEDIFLVDDENVFADRAVISEVQTPELVTDTEDTLPDTHYDVIPYYEEPRYNTNVFSGRSRHNQLMSKYPHMFLEEVTKSREDDSFVEPRIFNNYVTQPRVKAKINTENEEHPVDKGNTTTLLNDKSSKFDEIVNIIQPKQNYKLTVKILPANMSDLNAGFKEIHTSINKTYNRNGLMYSSLVNMTEISQIELLQKPPNETTTAQTTTTTEPSSLASHILEQKYKMQLLLDQHKKRIDDKLDHLRKERLSLDTMFSKDSDQDRNIVNCVTTEQIKLAETTETPFPKPEPTLHMSKEEISKLLMSLLNMKSQMSTSTSITVPTTSAAPMTTEVTTMVTPEPEKLKILNKIEHNENVTSEILHQINENTDMLRTFLQKLTDKLTKEKEPQKQQNEEFGQPKLDPNILRYWKPFQPVPETVYQPQFQYDPAKNNTHFSIPFVYAYQQPMTYKHNTPMASVVYHGHIHANSLGKHRKPQEIRTENTAQGDVVDNKNQTRFFIDELENDYKVMPPKKYVKSALKNTTVQA